MSDKRLQTAKTATASYFCHREKHIVMKRIWNVLKIMSVLLPVSSCNMGECFADKKKNSSEDGVLSHGMMVLGKQLEDPYSVKNITKAVEALYPTKAGSVDVSTTDLYVRFLPESQEQYDMLEAYGVEMLDHPVDFEIIKEGDYYHDPSIPENEITWQYAIVPPDFDFPDGVKYEILDHCHITEHEVITRSGWEDIDWDAVERESFRLTGNAGMLEDAAQSKGGAAKPSGRITLVDGRYPDNPEGVKGVRVACNVFVKIAQTYTDDQGNYEIGKKFSSKPRYWLVFKNKKGFGIGLNLILVGGSVSTMGRHSQEGCSMEISNKNDKSLFARCVVNNSVWDYFENCKTQTGSIKAPPANIRIWIFNMLNASSTPMMQHGAALDNTKIKEFLGEWATIVKWFLPDITLGLKGINDYEGIYATVTHELAHASHFQQVGIQWWDKLMTHVLTSFVTSGMMAYGTGGEQYAGYCEVAEMWAYYLSTKMFRRRYPESEIMFGTSWWFYPQIFYMLDDRGLDQFKIFQALIASVTDRDALQQKLLSLYPEFKTNIMLAFNRYL